MDQGEAVSRPTDVCPSVSPKAKVIAGDSDLLEVGDLRVNFLALTGVAAPGGGLVARAAFTLIGAGAPGPPIAARLAGSRVCAAVSTRLGARVSR